MLKPRQDNSYFFVSKCCISGYFGSVSSDLKVSAWNKNIYMQETLLFDQPLFTFDIFSL